MEITETRIKLLNNENTAIKALATIVIDDAIAVHNIKVRINKSGTDYYIAMPCRKDKDDYKDLVHPINQEAREYISNTILAQFKAMVTGEVVPEPEESDSEE